MSSRQKQGASSGSKKTGTKSSAGSKYPLLAGAVCFALWLCIFLFSDIFSKNPNGFGEPALRLLRVFRERLHTADFSSYTFSEGMGMSLFRLLLSGFGGILDLPLSLLPEKIHPQTLSLLNALRLGCAAWGFTFFLTRIREKLELLPALLSGIAYSAAAFLLCLLLHLPIADSFFLLPLFGLAIGSVLKKKTHDLTPKLIFAGAAYFCSNAVWGIFLLLPLLAGILLFLRNADPKPTRHHLIGLSLQVILSFGIVSVFLVPQLAQFPRGLQSEDPTSRFLAQLGNDTDKRSTDVTYSTEATKLLLDTSPCLFIVDNKATTFDPAGAYTSHFQKLNTWIYTLWPTLPVTPFQDATVIEPTFSDAKTVTFTMTTLFMDPLYVHLDMPNREHKASVYINDRLITEVENRNHVLVPLGEYNVGQTLTLKVTSSYAGELAFTTASFGYINSLDWSHFTVSANFGVDKITVTSDGISGESLVSGDSILLTNIPYEKGWELYLNGQKTPVTAYQGAWVSAPIPSGGYLIHLHYSAPGNLLGSILTALSFLALAIYYFSKSSSSMPKKSQIT